MLTPLSFTLSGEKSSVIWICISLYSYLPFLTIFFQDFGFCFVFRNLVKMYFGIYLLGFIVLGVCSPSESCKSITLGTFSLLFLWILSLVALPLCWLWDSSLQMLDDLLLPRTPWTQFICCFCSIFSAVSFD